MQGCPNRKGDGELDVRNIELQRAADLRNLAGSAAIVHVEVADVPQVAILQFFWEFSDRRRYADTVTARREGDRVL